MLPVNRVAQSEIIVFNLEELWDNRPIVTFDIAPYLIEGLVLQEKSFREAMKTLDWSAFKDKHVAISCSTDAIVPTWAYMLIASRLKDIAASTTLGTKEDVLREYFTRALEQVDWSRYEGKPVVIKGCGSAVVPDSAYVQATQKLQAVARKIMYGEPCSSVPIWRKPSTSSARPARTKKPAIPPLK